MSGGGGHRRAMVAALLAGIAVPADEGAEERTAERVAARLVWARRTCRAFFEAQEALTAAWDRQLEPYYDWNEEDIPELPDPPEQALVDKLWQEIDDVLRLNRWPRHLHWSL